MSSECSRGCEDGWLVDAATNSARRCDCWAQEARRRKVRTVLRELPETYRHVDFGRTPIKDLSPDVQAVLERYVRYHRRKVADGRGLWLQGDPGTGKTAVLALLAKHFAEHGHALLVRSVPALLTELRITEAEDTVGSWYETRDRLVALDVLGLDDLGSERPSEWALERLFEIINEREAAGRALWVTTNHDPNQLKRRLGWRIVSRLFGICGKPLVLEGPDNRELHAVDPLTEAA